ncbi:alpha/beta hydrolase [Nocardia jiangxiensis]|uniref:Alpha/beta hydrolase n=1 Tax=Nocardia jiangxiensis TaxID=282685 RepID=A0ABW6S279_9NOCA
MRRRSRIRTAAAAAATVALTALSVTTGAGVGSADPIIASKHLLASPTTADGSKISAYYLRDARHLTLRVHSAAMNQDITVEVQRPRDTSLPRPVLYLLNGAGGGEDAATWQRNTDALPYLADKNANIIEPIGGAWSYYTDWLKDDPVLGRNKWKTFFTRELPPLIDASLGTDGVHAIAGLSMAGTSVLALAIAQPGLYRSVASYSGCAQTSDPLGREVVKTAISVWGDGNPTNMWGADSSPLWAVNDPFVHADRLRGINLFLSSGSGIPGPYDTPNSPFLLHPGPVSLANQLLVGGLLEAGTNACTHNLQNRLNQLGIPVTVDYTATGTHSWGYWQDALKQSWPVLARGLGL